MIDHARLNRTANAAARSYHGELVVEGLADANRRII